MTSRASTLTESMATYCHLFSVSDYEMFNFFFFFFGRKVRGERKEMLERRMQEGEGERKV